MGGRGLDTYMGSASAIRSICRVCSGASEIEGIQYDSAGERGISKHKSAICRRRPWVLGTRGQLLFVSGGTGGGRSLA